MSWVAARAKAFLVFLTSTSVFATESPAQSYTKLSECYGETLDVYFEKYDPDGTGAEPERLYLSLPFPDAWYVNVRGPHELLSNAPCGTFAEPVHTTGLWAGFMDGRLGHAAPDALGGAATARVRSLRLNAYLDRESIKNHLQLFQKMVLEEGRPVLHGFWQRPAFGRYESVPTSGFLMLPDTHVAYDGSRIVASCAAGQVCNIEYMLTEDLLLSYEFWAGDNYYPDWLDSDGAMREVVKGWIIRN